MEKKKFDPGTEILGCFQMVKAALMPSSTSDDVTKTGQYFYLFYFLLKINQVESTVVDCAHLALLAAAARQMCTAVFTATARWRLKSLKLLHLDILDICGKSIPFGHSYLLLSTITI